MGVKIDWMKLLPKRKVEELLQAAAVSPLQPPSASTLKLQPWVVLIMLKGSARTRHPHPSSD
jgi:hypothetical protein